MNEDDTFEALRRQDAVETYKTLRILSDQWAIDNGLDFDGNWSISYNDPRILNFLKSRGWKSWDELEEASDKKSFELYKHT